MRRVVARFAGAGAVLAAAVSVAGIALAGIAAAAPIAFGAGLGWLVQVATFALLAGWLFPGQLLPVYGTGMLVRFALLALTAFVLLPMTGLAAAPALFALAAVLFGTTLLEPLFLAREAGVPSSPTAPLTQR